MPHAEMTEQIVESRVTFVAVRSGAVADGRGRSVNELVTSEVFVEDKISTAGYADARSRTVMVSLMVTCKIVSTSRHDDERVSRIGRSAYFNLLSVANSMPQLLPLPITAS